MPKSRSSASTRARLASTERTGPALARSAHRRRLPLSAMVYTGAPSCGGLGSRSCAPPSCRDGALEVPADAESRVARRPPRAHPDRYGHLFPGSEGEAAAALDAYLEEAMCRRLSYTIAAARPIRLRIWAWQAPATDRPGSLGLRAIFEGKALPVAASSWIGLPWLPHGLRAEYGARATWIRRLDGAVRWVRVLMSQRGLQRATLGFPSAMRVGGDTATGIRTPVSAVRGRRPSPLDDGGSSAGDCSDRLCGRPFVRLCLRTFIGRWLREVRCEAGAVPPL
jgi:hypothetical protein